MRVVVGMIVLEFPTPWAETPSDYLSKGLELFDAYKGHPLVSLTFAPHAPYSIADETFNRIRTLADELDVGVHIHLHETAEEVADAISQTGQRPLARLDELGLVTPGLIAVHATQLLDEEIETLAAAGSHVVHCPRSNLKLASGTCRTADLVAAGVNVAIGTDGAASNNRLDLWSEMMFTALVGKNHVGNAEALPAASVLHMATMGGARALGLDQRIGSLEVGKAADAICVRLDAPEVVPVLDPLSQLIYSAGREHVTDAWVAGEHVLADGTLTQLEEPLVLERVSEWAQRVREP
jgi:5-methylthioadenosine/S-adenosylhomocysteine deaminase